MCGFLVPLLCGASVVHLETLRPELVLGALKERRVTHMSAVPALLSALERRLRERLRGLPPLADAGLRGLKALNRFLTRKGPNHAISRALLHPVHDALGGRLRRIFAGGAFVPAGTARVLYELGLPVAVGYGLTEACAVVSVNDLAPFRDDTVGPPVPGTEIRLHGRDGRGRGEVWVRGPQVFAGYLDDPELSAATLEDGWLKTGDLGEIDATGHLRLVGRIKNMIVTAGGKNVYPEDVEGRFHGVDAEELAVLAAHTVWSGAPGEDEALLLAVRPRGEKPALREQLLKRNRRLPAYQRAEGVLWVDDPFPRTTSLKLKRAELARSLRARGREALERL
jgi:long-chain acyl-CoA synthetase